MTFGGFPDGADRRMDVRRARNASAASDLGRTKVTSAGAFPLLETSFRRFVLFPLSDICNANFAGSEPGADSCLFQFLQQIVIELAVRVGIALEHGILDCALVQL